MLSLSPFLFFFAFLLHVLSKVLAAAGNLLERHASLECSDSKGVERKCRGNNATQSQFQNHSYLLDGPTTPDKIKMRKAGHPDARRLRPSRSSHIKRAKRTCHGTTKAGKPCRNFVKQADYCRVHLNQQSMPQAILPELQCATVTIKEDSDVEKIKLIFVDIWKFSCKFFVASFNPATTVTYHPSKLALKIPHQPPPRIQTTVVDSTSEILLVPGVDRRGKLICCDGTSFSLQQSNSCRLVKSRLDSSRSSKDFGLHANTT
jgi:hypothetical protein